MTHASQYPHSGRLDSSQRPVPLAGLGIPLLVLLTAGWVLIGLIGHDPWKPDEAHTFGIVLDVLRRGDWVVPSLTGEPFVEKPPLFYLVAAGFAHAFGLSLLPPHDAARLATGSFVAVSLLFLALTGRELCGRNYGVLAVLVMIGCVGSTARLHQLIPDVALLAGVAIGMYGLAVGRRSVWGAGVALGVGMATAFLAKGLLGPGWLALCACALPVIAAWRTRRYAMALAVAGAIAVVPAAIWVVALYTRSPALFADWFVTNNLGRFFGFTRVGPHNAPGFYAQVLWWYAFPALPLAAWTVWRAWRNNESRIAQPELVFPLLLVAVMLTVLAVASDSRDLYLMPLLLPLSLLAAQGLTDIPALGSMVLSQAARWGLGALALMLWLGWVSLLTGFPAPLHAALLAYQPNFAPKVHYVHLGLALGATGLAAWVLAHEARHADLAVTQWAAAVTLCWSLIATLWTPYLNAGKSYRTMMLSLMRELPAGECVASLHLGEPQRALLEYFAHVQTVRLEVRPDASCPALLVQGWRGGEAPQLPPPWSLVWEGARPGDKSELYRLYRRDGTPSHTVARFP